MKKTILSFLLLFILTNSFSQDLIVTTAKDSINCLIEYTSLRKISFKTLNSNKEYEKKNLKMESVLDYKFDYYADINSKTLTKKDTLTKKEASIKDSINLTKPKLSYDMFSFGFGLGLDYGGIGINVLKYVFKNVGVFGGVGLAGYKPSYNTGIKVRLNPEPKNSHVVPYFTAMYGYNAVVIGKNNSGLNHIYFGTSVGVGIDIKSKKKKPSYWSLQLIVPFRSKEAYTLTTEYMPILLSIGFRGF